MLGLDLNLEFGCWCVPGKLAQSRVSFKISVKRGRLSLGEFSEIIQGTWCLGTSYALCNWWLVLATACQLHVQWCVFSQGGRVKSRKWLQNECQNGIAPIMRSKKPKGHFFRKKKATMPETVILGMNMVKNL